MTPLRHVSQKYNGYLCNNMTCSISTVPHQKLISQFLNIYPKLHDKDSVTTTSWAIEYCELQEPKMRMTLLFERTGVQPYCPWHWHQGVYADEYCKATRDARTRHITVYVVDTV